MQNFCSSSVVNPTEPADVLTQQQLLRHPDFVVERKRGQFWQVREKVFDYQGRFRRANELY